MITRYYAFQNRKSILHKQFCVANQIVVLLAAGWKYQLRQIKRQHACVTQRSTAQRRSDELIYQNSSSPSCAGRHPCQAGPVLVYPSSLKRHNHYRHGTQPETAPEAAYLCRSRRIVCYLWPYPCHVGRMMKRICNCCACSRHETGRLMTDRFPMSVAECYGCGDAICVFCFPMCI